MKCIFLLGLCLGLFFTTYEASFAWFLFAIDRIFQINMSNQVNYFCKLEKQMKPAAPLNELHYHNMTMKEFQKLFFNYKPFVVRNFSTNNAPEKVVPVFICRSNQRKANGNCRGVYGR